MNSTSNLHPSVFETPIADTPKDDRTLFSTPGIQVIDYSGPDGRYKFTDADNKLSSENTSSVFGKEHSQTLLTELFFSRTNIKSIQTLIRYIVHKQTGFVIDEQSSRELLIIMRSVFLEYNMHPPLVPEDATEAQKRQLHKSYTREVARLNEIVVNEAVPKIVSQIQQYIGYIRDISNQPMPGEIPKNVSIKGNRQYRSVTQVLIGGDL